jgi:uncharacterized protein involved in exopolysaccharide biosynthesis
MSLLDAAAILLRRPRLVVVYPVLLAALVVASTYLRHPLYKAVVSFAPGGPAGVSLPSGLSSFASRLGLNLPTDATQSPAFYVSVLRSRDITEHLLLSRFADPRSKVNSDSTTLLLLIDVRADTRAESLAAGVKRLARDVEASWDARTGIVTVAVETRFASLSAAVATRLVDLLNQFNTSQRQSQARERRKFVGTRLTEVEEELRQAEENLRRFYESNRSWNQSPQLVIEEGRLHRQIDIIRDVYLTLQREYELSRVEEVNDTPVLTVVDPAVPPVRKSRPQRARIGIATLLVGMILGSLGAFGADYLERVRVEDPTQYRELIEVLRSWRRRLFRA